MIWTTLFFSYSIYQKSDQDFTKVRSVTHERSADTVEVAIDNLSPDQSYEYRVLLHHDEITYGDVNTVGTSLTIPSGRKLIRIVCMYSILKYS